MVRFQPERESNRHWRPLSWRSDGSEVRGSRKRAQHHYTFILLDRQSKLILMAGYNSTSKLFFMCCVRCLAARTNQLHVTLHLRCHIGRPRTDCDSGAVQYSQDHVCQRTSRPRRRFFDLCTSIAGFQPRRPLLRIH